MDDSTSENRKKTRTLATGELISVSLRPDGTDKEILGFVVDKSADGFQISIPEEIAPQTIVFITTTRQSESGSGESESFIVKIRWCKKDTYFDGFDVGVEILGFASAEQ
jgi:hypothetical protein